MSLSFGWYSSECISEKELFGFVISIGGTVQELSDSLSQCIIERENEVIWIMDDKYFMSELEVEDHIELEEWGIFPKSSATIFVGLNGKRERSVSLAKWFCEELLLKYPDTIIMAFDKYYTINTIKNIPYNEK